ncbi:hypothetical protein EK21DRAFT_95757 [Setomelanomma holmii]|uniref:Uncharacterized protein n=1 Tax=Setomelanomma holmii TaxID=210430 RepID=A0A9P4HLF0_9PLEO|nr:hypothetical protein EK21DRAFT_95757 [Setomelanomma holmii]
MILISEKVKAVAYHIPTSPANLRTTISLPLHSTWSSGLHFHTQHTEYLHLLQGSICLTLNAQTHILSAAAGGTVSPYTGHLLKPGLVIEVPRYARHNWSRAESKFTGRGFGVGVRLARPEDVDEQVIVEEWTSPFDISKPLFFWNLNGVITAPEDVPLSLLQTVVKRVLGPWWIPFQLFVIFWELDNWPVFVGMRGLVRPWEGAGEWVFRCFEGLVEYVMTFVVLFAAKVLGWVIGVRAVERARTPVKLWEAYDQR